MSIPIIKNDLQNQLAEVESARYNVVETNTQAIRKVASEQPQQVTNLFEALGVGHNVDLMV